MNLGRMKYAKIFVTFVSLVFISFISSNIVFALTALVTSAPTAPVNRVELNFTQTNATDNVTQVNFTLPTGLFFVGTTSNSNSSLTGTIAGQTIYFGDNTTNSSTPNNWFAFNITSSSGGTFSISAKEVNNASGIVTTSITLAITNGTLTLTNASFSNATYDGSNSKMNFTLSASAATGGGTVGDNITSRLYVNNVLQVTNYSAGSIGVANYTATAANLYTLIFNTSGTNNYTAASLTADLNISRAVPDLKLYIDNSTTNGNVTYPSSLELRGNATFGNTTAVNLPTFNLYANNTLLGTGNTPIATAARIGNGTYNIVYNTSLSENYTSASNSSLYLFVNKATPQLTILGVTNGTYPLTETINFTSDDVDGLTVSLLRNGTSTANKTATIYPVGLWNFTVNISSTQNYTANSTEVWNNITKGTPNITIYVNGSTSASYVVEKGDLINITVFSDATVDNVTGAMQIYTNYSGSNATIVNLTGIGNMLYNFTNTSLYAGNLTLGNYTISANQTSTANYSAGANNTIILVVRDTTAPTITSFTLTKTGYIYQSDTLTSSDFSCLSTDNDGPLTTVITGIDTSVTGPKTATCTVTDPSSHSTTKTLIYMISSFVAASPSSSSSATATSAPTETQNAIAFILSIAANGSATVNISKDTNTSVNEINIGVNDKAFSLVVNVVKLASKPSDVATAPSGTTYSYLNINVDNLASSNVKTATIKFFVPKSWMQQYSIDPDSVYLNRFANNQWNKLSTSKINEDADFVYYEATTPGFSYFSISGQIKAAATTTTTTPSTTTTTTTVPSAAVGIEWVYAAIALLIIAVMIFYSRKFLKKK